MLILPLHKPFTLATLPLVTLLLVVANALVYFGWQLGDARRLEAAQAWYLQSGLGGYEVPAYEKYLRQAARRDALAAFEALPEARRAGFVGMSTLSDVAFVTAMEEGRLLESAQRHAAWQALRRPYQARLDEVFTLRHVMRSSEWSPARMLSSAFLHGGFMHLLGNMLFLVVLGLLLEGALGGWRFLGVYLLGAFGASLASLWWRWGESGSGLGASGAVAALMGAFCVVWGRRPVRFFYWFAVVFDYVRAPAIWLLPLWLGWEVYNLLANTDAGIGFDAHAGGLVCGAALGGLLVATGQVREDYMADDARAGAIVDGRWEQALQHMGRLQNDAAERLLGELAGEQPQRLDVAVARYRVACNAGRPADMQARALDVLRLDAGADAASQAVQHQIAKTWLAGAMPLNAEAGRLLFERCLAAGWLREAEAALERDTPRPGGEPAQAWLRLALRHGELHAREQQRRLLALLERRYPQAPQAAKARFLLEND